jgi:hypothetical protein
MLKLQGIRKRHPLPALRRGRRGAAIIAIIAHAQRAWMVASGSVALAKAATESERMCNASSGDSSS